MFIKKLKKIINLFLKILLLLVVVITAFYFELELAGGLVFIFIIVSLLGKWDSKISLISGVFLLLYNFIFQLLNRQDLIVPHLYVYGLILVGLWLLEVIDYAAKHWPEHLKEFGKNININITWPSKERTTGEVSRRIRFNGEFKWRAIKNIFKNFLTGFKNFTIIFYKISLKFSRYFYTTLLFLVVALARWSVRIIKEFLLVLIKKHKVFIIKIIIITAAGFLLRYFTPWKIVDIFVWLFFLASILFRRDGRPAIAVALILLIAIPILLIYKMPILAEIVAVYVYYFLVMGVILDLWELVREGRKKVASNK